MYIIQTMDNDGNEVTITADDYRVYADDKVLFEFKHSEVEGAESIVYGLLRDTLLAQKVRDSWKFDECF